MGRVSRSFAGALVALGGTCACGRLGFGGDPGVGDGGRGEDGGADARALDGTICDELPGLLLCEPLDTGSALPTVNATPPNSLTFDTTRPYRGIASLHSHTEASTTPAWRLGQILGRITTGDIHARWYMYLPSTVTQPIASTHLVEDTLPFHGVVFGVQNGTPEVTNVSFGTGVGSAPMPRDRWVCVQLHIVVDATAGVVESWIDGAPSGRLDGQDTLPATGFNNVHIGHFSGGPPHTEIADVWTDELAVGTAPIPCD